MEKAPIRWNVSVPSSVGRQIDQIAREGDHGDKSLLCGLGMALVLLIPERDRKLWMERFEIAFTRARYGGTTVEELKKLLNEQRVAQIPLDDVTPPAAAPTPPSRLDIESEVAEGVRQSRDREQEHESRRKQSHPRRA
jgi:hypothetical protein